MRRVFILLFLIAADAWLMSNKPYGPSSAGSSGLFSGTAAAQQSCCVSGTSPHLECVAGQCQQVYTCGFDNCSACSCDPTGSLEQQCLIEGGTWDPGTCTCIPPPPPTSCDPTGALERSCAASGGIWDPVTCTCGNGSICVLDQPVLVGTDFLQKALCADYCESTVCTYEEDHYVQYCTDGTFSSAWTEEILITCDMASFDVNCCSY
jgi:hypothetical protein